MKNQIALNVAQKQQFKSKFEAIIYGNRIGGQMGEWRRRMRALQSLEEKIILPGMCLFEEDGGTARGNIPIVRWGLILSRGKGEKDKTGKDEKMV
jgi:hypothetical protein